jgi:hypothetical protein
VHPAAEPGGQPPPTACRSRIAHQHQTKGMHQEEGGQSKNARFQVCETLKSGAALNTPEFGTGWRPPGRNPSSGAGKCRYPLGSAGNRGTLPAWDSMGFAALHPTYILMPLPAVGWVEAARP